MKISVTSAFFKINLNTFKGILSIQSVKDLSVGLKKGSLYKQVSRQGSRFKFGPTNVMQRLTDSVFSKTVYIIKPTAVDLT